MQIEYKFDITPSPEVIIELYDNSGLPRLTKDAERIRKMYENI